MLQGNRAHERGPTRILQKEIMSGGSDSYSMNGKMVNAGASIFRLGMSGCVVY